jgi:hypothetical protein
LDPPESEDADLADDDDDDEVDDAGAEGAGEVDPLLPDPDPASALPAPSEVDEGEASDFVEDPFELPRLSFL